MSRYCKHGVISDMCNNPECCPLAPAKEKAEARRSAAACSPFFETEAMRHFLTLHGWKADDHEPVKTIISVLARVERERNEAREMARDMRNQLRKESKARLLFPWEQPS